MCSMMLPYRLDTMLIKPCYYFCEVVEQRCPYFLPHLIYAGEPAFLCIDRDIPDLYMQNVSKYGECPECYLPCHLSYDGATYDGELCHDLPGENRTLKPLHTCQTLNSASRTIPEFARRDAVFAALLGWVWSLAVMYFVVGFT
ncbi:PREDICTED: uncharacterized protein LOC106812437 [Priapulus caudatus]|uniref:Uncharacterized protein LOC106812437 n=1 Tax=Priapulus caudatus TaxID=37621 RepID=A0ABM1EHY6_PRICU|nr:PREDICTED: uncharacterized protein LOC106812437 [Priapulus caudatus]